jgi:4-carboxymuconolactone decarboxylase
MTPKQASLRDVIQLSHLRMGLSGPFGPWLSLPAIAGLLQELGRAVRYGMLLLSRESELVILLMGARYESDAELDIHINKVRRAGLG